MKVVALFVFAATLLGCVNTPISKPGGDAAFNKSVSADVMEIKPLEKSAMVPFTIPDEGVELSLSLPIGSTQGKRPQLFVGPKENAYVSVRFEGKGKVASNTTSQFLQYPSQRVTCKDFHGGFQEKFLRGTTRRERLYYMASKSFGYSMMTSWEDSKPAAKAEAEELARYIANTISMSGLHGHDMKPSSKVSP